MNITKIKLRNRFLKKLNDRKLTLWEKSYFIATIIIAIVAIIGFIKSSSDSRNTAETLDKLTRSLEAFIQPTIGLSNITWITTEELNCNNSPMGINLEYTNSSNIAILIENPGAETIYGVDTLSGYAVNSLYPDSSIVGAGQKYAFTIQGSKFFKKLRNKKNILKAPFLIVNFHCNISTLGLRNKYRFSLSHAIGVDCSNWFQKNITTFNESIQIIQTE